MVTTILLSQPYIMSCNMIHQKRRRKKEIISNWFFKSTKPLMNHIVIKNCHFLQCNHCLFLLRQIAQTKKKCWLFFGGNIVSKEESACLANLNVCSRPTPVNIKVSIRSTRGHYYNELDNLRKNFKHVPKTIVQMFHLILDQFINNFY